MVTGRFIPAHAVDRPGLRRELDAALTRPLTLLIAQAGSGKSVLLSQWVAAHPDIRFGWLDVVAADDDPSVLLGHLMDALVGCSPDPERLGRLLLERPAHPWPGFSSSVVDALSEMGEAAIVLEDLHLLTDPDSLGTLRTMIEQLPPNLHLVFSSRADPPVAWSRTRLRHEVRELRQAAFAMTFEETDALLTAITGRELERVDVAALLDRTEGWVAGIQLAAMSLRVRQDDAGFIAEFGGSDRLIADYLTEVVLDALTEGDRAALLDLSALDQFSVDLVCEFADRRTAPDLLARLERRSMFLIPLDDSRERFRFHQLFRDLLRYRMRSADPRAERRVLVRAGEWYLARGELGPAIEHFLRARDWDRAIEVILERGSDAFERGDVATVAGWLDAVPEHVLAHRTDALVLRGILGSVGGAPAMTEDRLHAIAARPGNTPMTVAYAETFLAALVHRRPHPEVSIARAEQAISTIAELGEVPASGGLPDPATLTTIAMLSSGQANFLAGDFDQARRRLTDALASDGAGYSVWRISVLGSLAMLDAWCGRMRQAEQSAGEALSLARETSGRHHLATAEAYLARARVWIANAQPDRADEPLRQGASRARENGRELLSWIAYAEDRAANDLQSRRGAFDRPTGPPPPLVAEALLVRRSRTLRLQGSIDEASRILDGQTALTTSSRFETAATALSLGQLDAARECMRTFGDLPDSGEPIGRVRELVLASWYAASVGLSARADLPLIEALEIADEHGLVTVFVEAGPVIVARIGAIADDRFRGIRQAVLDAAPDRGEPGGPDHLADPLTDRELELLAVLPTRFTNTELASRFVVSVNTIKTHLAHIYRKLGVSNRTSAIARAGQLGLLGRRWSAPIPELAAEPSSTTPLPALT